MSFTADRLYELLPAVYRIRDAEEGGPLRQLVEVIAEQVAVLEENIDRLYDDQFIETCAEWVVPYIGDLLGVRGIHSLEAGGLSARAQVANTLAYRRRKGTASVLEQLARDVTNWPARVVEFFELLATTQNLNHLRPHSLHTPDLRDVESLERLDTPFDKIAHTLDVRRIESNRGKHNVPNVGIFLYRLDAFPLTDAKAFRVRPRHFTFSPLGSDGPLFNRPVAETEISHLAEPTNVPMPISRLALFLHKETHYGRDKSIFLTVNGVEIEPRKIFSCDLSDAGATNWAHTPPPDGFYAVDPVLGRVALPASQSVPAEVKVRFSHGFAHEIGGGEYQRVSEIKRPATLAMPGGAASMRAAFDAVVNGGVLEIRDSSTHAVNTTLALPAGRSAVLEVVDPSPTDREAKLLEVRAADGSRPVLDLNGDLTLSGAPGTEIALNGLVITGGTLVVGENLRKLTLRHCTLVPGIRVSRRGPPQSPAAPVLIVNSEETEVEIDSCIVGGLRIADGASCEIRNSIVDAVAAGNVAYAGPGPASPGGPLTVVNGTVIGRVRTHEMKLASNSIFLAEGAAPIHSEVRQEGCVRFSWLPQDSRTPRRYRCQPESPGSPPRVRPLFTSLRYGDPGYMQLSPLCPEEIRGGAEDESEMGAFHDLFTPLRETNLRVRLDEYLRFGLEAGIFYVT